MEDTAATTMAQPPPQPAATTTKAQHTPPQPLLPELGFIVLEECYPVVIAVDESNKAKNGEDETTTTGGTTPSPPPAGQWINVTFCDDENDKDDKKKPAAAAAAAAAARSSSDDHNVCQACNLILCHHEQEKGENKNTSLALKWNEVEPFDGLVSGMVHETCNNDCGSAATTADNGITDNSSTAAASQQHYCQNGQQQRRRSDAALVFGMLRLLQRQVVVRNCKILFHNDKAVGGSSPSSTTNTASSGTLCRRRATIVLTVTFPYLFPSKSTHACASSSSKKRQSSQSSSWEERQRCIVPYAGSTTKNLKPLHPALQLLLSLIRSDWSRLDAFMEFMATKNDTKMQQAHSRRTTSLFPQSAMSLDELYQRIQGSTTSGSCGYTSSALSLVNAARKDDDDDDDVTTKACRRPISTLAHLPKDILVDNLVPFLKARSLDALRCTCKDLHEALRASVPGLCGGLQLYHHQVTSLSWMRDRETFFLQESDCLTSSKSSSSSLTRGCPDADLHRAVTGGYSVLLVQRPNSSNSNNNNEEDALISFRIKQSTGEEIPDHDIARDGPLQRNVARGGLLVDEPGLGKTITVLSLILQTAGLTTTFAESNTTTNNSSSPTRRRRRPPTEEEIIQLYWNESVPLEYRQKDLLRLVNRLGKIHPFFALPTIRRDIEKDRFGSSFASFEAEIKSNIQSSYPSSDSEEARLTAAAVTETFEALVQEWKQSQLASARKSYSNASTKPNSGVAALFAQYQRQEFYDSLVQSSGTLIVIPHVLMEHWKTQIERYVDLNYMTATGKIPLVFDYGNGKTREALSVDKAIIMTQLHATHEAVVFFDHGSTRPLPPADFLSMFKIVVTTSKRFKNEWKNGSFQEELRDSKSVESDSADVNYGERSFRQSNEACSLLKIHWLRMIVDEGHSMNKGDQRNNTIQFASWISAERRWAMTGTPTKQATNVAIKQVHGLLQFLKHDFFNRRLDGTAVWNNNIAKSWRDGHLAGFFRLRSLLGLLMKRHTKLGIVPPPIFQEKVIPMSSTEVTTYNVIVTVVQSNLLLTSMTEDARQDSLLHASQRKFAMQTLDNVRRVCAGFSRNVTSLTNYNFLETIRLAEYHHGFSESQVSILRKFMHGAQDGHLSNCTCCGMSGLLILLVMPCCLGLLCTECMDSRTAECPLCDQTFDIDDFQRLQPGFETEWLDNVKAAKKPRQHSPRVVSNAPVEQAAGEGPPNRPENVELVAHPVVANRPAGPSPPRRTGHHHICQYDRKSSTGMCTICRAEHDRCNLALSLRCNTCHRVAQECSPDETKPKYLVDRILSLYKEQVMRAASGRRQKAQRPLKVIVFSQYQKALNLVGDRLLGRLGSSLVAEYYGKWRKEELHRFTVDDQCICMLLGKDGSEGLDLSFVTHIFFVEEIWDQSLADQAVARAWRMGAQGPVEVETLIAQNTVEETMRKVEVVQQPERAGAARAGNGTSGRHGSSARKQEQEATLSKTHVLLKGLRLITDYHHFASNNSNDSSNNSSSSNQNEDTSIEVLGIAREGELKRKREEEAPSATAVARTKKVRFDMR